MTSSPEWLADLSQFDREQQIRARRRAGNLPYGYRYQRAVVRHLEVDRIEPEPEKAEAVKMAFYMRASGATLAEIAAALNALGAPRRHSSRPWSKSAIYRLLSNPAYAGDLTIGIPPLVSLETWRQVNKGGTDRGQTRQRYDRQDGVSGPRGSGLSRG